MFPIAKHAARHNVRMQEIELKFQIPAQQVEAVRAAVAQAAPGIEPLALQAAYFDTMDSRLAGHRMALRVRREGADWVQTFKAAGRDAMTRVEDNQATRAPLDGRIKPDLALHTDPKVRQALARAWDREDLGKVSAHDLGLQAVYETRFDRWSCRSTQPQGQVIVCVDVGEVLAGQLSEPLSELEIELAEGKPIAVIDAARHWVDHHGVWLDVQSKAHRGTRLAQADRHGQPAPAEALAHGLQPWLDGQAEIEPKRVLSAVLDAAAGNWSEVAAARPGWPDALQAWHVALQGLLTLGDRHAALRAALPDAVWKKSVEIESDLERLRTSAEQTGTAQALARGARTTHWGLDLLAAIQR